MSGMRWTAADGRSGHLPLLGVEVEALLDGGSAEVVTRQRWCNPEKVALEATYVFPLPADAAVHGFTAFVEGRRVEGRVMGREAAFATWDDAVSEGHGAFLLDAERPDIFSVTLGNLKPGVEVVLELRWVTRLHVEGPAWRFSLPTTVSPRYVAAGARPEVGEPDSDRINPPKVPKVSYGLSFSLSVAPGFGPVSRIESPTHPLRLTLGPTPKVELSQPEAPLDRDLVVLVESQFRGPRASVATGPHGERFVEVAFIPEGLEAAQEGQEFVFVLDCSGSMGGASIAEARRALELCVRALGAGDTFEIIRFGSSWQATFGAARPYDQASLDEALACIRRTDANMGGTELLAPLRYLTGLSASRPRTVVVLTDGQISNEAEVVALLGRHAATHRCFSFGIGSGASESLVRGLARVTRGEAEFIAPGERIEPKVLRQFGRMRTPSLTDVRVDWGGLEVEQVPTVLPGVFQGEPLTVRARVKAGTSAAVTLHGGGRSWTVPLDLERATAWGPIPRMWARALITELEDAGASPPSAPAAPLEVGPPVAGGHPELNARLLTLGWSFGIVSRATSMVAVEIREEGDRVTETPLKAKVPVALTAGWGGSGGFGAFGTGGAVAPVGPPPASMPAFASMPAPMPVSPGRFAAPPPPAVPPAMSVSAAPSSSEPRRARARGESPVAATVAFDAGPGGAPSSSDPLDRLFALLSGQQADGSFTRDAVLAATADRAGLEAALAAAEPGSVPSVLTAAALVILEARFAEQRPLWEAAARKARDFLAK